MDSVWLGVIARKFYAGQIGHLMGDSFKILPALIFYIIYATAITFFIVLPAIKGEYSWTKVFFTGAFFGLVAYATYDLTNQATIKDWSTTMTLVDVAWGTMLTGFGSVVSVYIVKFFS